MKLFLILMLGTTFCLGMEEKSMDPQAIPETYSGQNFMAFDHNDKSEHLQELNRANTEELLTVFRMQSANRDIHNIGHYPFYLSNYDALLAHAGSIGINVIKYGVDLSHLGQNLAYFEIDENSTADIQKMSIAEALGLLEQLKQIKEFRIEGDNTLLDRNYDALIEYLKTLGIQ